MKNDIWADRSNYISDPEMVRNILRNPQMSVAPMHDYIEQIEHASGVDLSALRMLTRNALVSQPAEEHLATRRIISAFFSDRNMAEWEPHFHDCIAAALETLAAADRPDLMVDFVQPLFIRMISRMVGFQDDGSDRLFPMIDIVQRVTEPMLPLRDLRALNEAILYLQCTLPDLRDAPSDRPENLLSYMRRKQSAAHETVDLHYTTIALTVAANTVAQTLGFILYGLLMDTADTWKNAARHDWVASNLDRLLGLWPSTLTLVRAASADVSINGCPFDQGEAAVMDMPQTNGHLRQTALYPAQAQNLSFGAGVHKCPGEALSRRLLGLTLPALAQRFPRLALHKDMAEFRATPMVQTPVTLPCELYGDTTRVNARLIDVKTLPDARAIVMDNDNYMPPAMEAHLRALAQGSGRDLSPAIMIARNAMFFMSGDRHASARRIIAGCLGGNRLPAWQDLFDTQAQMALDTLAASAHPDLIEDFADPLFRGITHPILGIDVADSSRFNELAPILQDVLEPWLPMRELLRLQDVFDELLGLMRLPADMQRQGPASVLGAMLAEEPDDFGTDDIKALVLVLYGASFNLSHTLGNVLHWLLIQPREMQPHYHDPAWVHRNLEQLISLCASPKYIYRMARCPSRINDIDVAPGETTRMQLLSINRGVATGNLAFGHGLHHCVGAGLSRMMLRTAVPALFQRFPDLMLRPQSHQYFDMSQTVAMKKLPCVPGAAIHKKV